MRKRLKKKKHSCAMCKPHKMCGESRCGESRWTDKDEQQLKQAEKIKQDIERIDYRKDTTDGY